MLVAGFGQLVFMGKGTRLEVFSIQNMKAAFWIDILSMFLWPSIVAEVTRRTDNLEEDSGKVDWGVLDEQERGHKLEELDSDNVTSTPKPYSFHLTVSAILIGECRHNFNGSGHVIPYAFIGSRAYPFNLLADK